MSNLTALEEFLSARPVPGPQAALARSLASAIDAAPEVGLAALAKEYRALLKELAGDAAPPDDADAWLAGLSSPLGDPAGS